MLLSSRYWPVRATQELCSRRMNANRMMYLTADTNFRRLADYEAVRLRQTLYQRSIMARIDEDITLESNQRLMTALNWANLSSPTPKLYFRIYIVEREYWNSIYLYLFYMQHNIY